MYTQAHIFKYVDIYAHIDLCNIRFTSIYIHTHVYEYNVKCIDMYTFTSMKSDM